MNGKETKMNTATTELAYLNKLPEVGESIRRFVERDEELRALIAEEQKAHRERMKSLRSALRANVKKATRAASDLWSAAEIADAKRKATPHAAVPSHEAGEPGTKGAKPWCVECFADVTDPVHVNS